MKSTHNVNDNESNESEYNVNDNVRGTESFVRRIIVQDISEQKLKRVQDFLFRERTFDSKKEILNLSIKQIEHFVCLWYTEISDPDRKAIAGMYLEYDGDGRSRPYKEYTESPLWKYTSSVFKAERKFTCERCKKRYLPSHLVVHHKSYEHLGSELNYPEDMELLCTDCHLKEHEIRR